MLKFLSFFQAKPLHDPGHAVGRAEVAHEIVFKADVKTRAARIALARATAAQLPVDSARFVAFRSDDIESAAVRHGLTQFDVTCRGPPCSSKS